MPKKKNKTKLKDILDYSIEVSCKCGERIRFFRNKIEEGVQIGNKGKNEF